MTQYDLHIIEDFVRKSITPYSIKLAAQMMDSIDWDSIDRGRDLYNWFFEILNRNEKRFVQDDPTGNDGCRNRSNG